MGSEVVEKPRVTALVGNSIRFLWQNQNTAWAALRPVFMFIVPLFFITYWASYTVEVAKEVGHDVEGWVYLLLIVASVLQTFFVACCILSWHRMYFNADERYVIDPAAFREGDLRAVLSLLCLFVAPAAFFLLMGGVFFLLSVVMPEGAAGIGAGILGVALIVFMIYAAVQFARFFFVVPAWALGHDVTLMEARRLSKGLLWKLFAASFLMGLALFALIVAVVVVGGIPLLIIAALVTLPEWVGHVLWALMNAGGTLLSLFLYTSILSQLYQWAIENRAAES